MQRIRGFAIMHYINLLLTLTLTLTLEKIKLSVANSVSNTKISASGRKGVRYGTLLLSYS